MTDLRKPGGAAAPVTESAVPVIIGQVGIFLVTAIAVAAIFVSGTSDRTTAMVTAFIAGPIQFFSALIFIFYYADFGLYYSQSRGKEVVMEASVRRFHLASIVSFLMSLEGWGLTVACVFFIDMSSRWKVQAFLITAAVTRIVAVFTHLREKHFRGMAYIERRLREGTSPPDTQPTASETKNNTTAENMHRASLAFAGVHSVTLVMTGVFILTGGRHNSPVNILILTTSFVAGIFSFFEIYRGKVNPNWPRIVIERKVNEAIAFSATFAASMLLFTFFIPFDENSR